MRRALADSIAASPVHQSSGYVRGSIILCVSCGRPLFRLEASIGLGEPAGRAAAKLKPVRPMDLSVLAAREEVDAGLRAWIRSLGPSGRLAYCDRIPAPTAGDLCQCAQCGHAWVEARAAEVGDLLDRGYTLELHAIPPDGPPPPMKGLRDQGGPFTVR